jgi:hypothetical protein
MPASRPFRLLAKIPYFVPAQFDCAGRYVIRPEIKGAAARMIEPGVVPVAGRNGILDAGTVEWKTPYGHSLVAGSTTLWTHGRRPEHPAFLFS